MTTGESRVTRPAHRWQSLGTVYIAPPQVPSHRSFGLTVGVVLLLLMNGESESGRKNVLWISLITTVFTFVVSLLI